MCKCKVLIIPESTWACEHKWESICNILKLVSEGYPDPFISLTLCCFKVQVLALSDNENLCVCERERNNRRAILIAGDLIGLGRAKRKMRGGKKEESYSLKRKIYHS